MLQMARRTLAICVLVGLCFGVATSPANPRKAATGQVITREGKDRKQEDISPSREQVFDLFKEKGRPRRVSTKIRNVYFVELKPSMLLSATVQQRGIDVSVELFDPLGMPLLTIDSHNSDRGPEPVLLVAERAGQYRVVISTSSSKHDNSSTAYYFIESIGRRIATAHDRKRAFALQVYYRARALDQKRDAKRREADLLFAEEALRAAGERDLDADALADIGALYMGQAEWRNAVAFYQRTVSLLMKLGRKREEAVFLNEWARGEQSLNQVERAKSLFARAARLAHEAKDAKTEATSLTNLGGFHAERSEAREAGIALQKALHIWSELGDTDGTAKAMAAFGLLYEQMGQAEKGLDYYRSALSLKGLGSSTRSMLLTQAGNAYVSAGSLDRALQSFQLALEVEHSTRDVENEAGTLDGLGLALVRESQFNDALEPYRRALEIYQSLKDSRSQAVILMNLGWAFGALSRYDEARDCFDRALVIARASKNAVWEAGIRLGFAWNERRRGRLDEARRQAEQALKLIEHVRSGTDDKDLRVAFFSSKQDVYDLLISILMDKAQSQNSARLVDDAFEISESARARTLLDLVGGREAPVLSVEGIRDEVLDADTVLLEYALGEPMSQLWLVSRGGIEAFNLPGRKVIEDLAHDVYEGLTKSRLQRMTTSTVEKWVELSHMLLGPVAKRLDMKRLLIASSGALQSIPFAALADPDVPFSGGGRRTRPQPLMVRHEILAEPSASVLSQIRRRRVGRRPASGFLTVLADAVFERDDPRIAGNSAAHRGVGDAILGYLDRLPASRKEAETISAGIAPSKVLKALDFEANLDLFTSGKIADFQTIHIATHTLHPAGQPGQEAIVLSRFNRWGRPRNGLLRIQDIGALNLRSDLVVLSSCSSGLGRSIPGEGMIGLPQAFLSAGASEVVGSVWDVDDESTADLMALFYKNLWSLRMTPSRALQKAQIEIWERPDRNAPWFWAGFVAQGDWRGDPGPLNKMPTGVSIKDGSPRNVWTARRSPLVQVAW